MSIYLITGAALGLGKALSKQLTAQNHEVILLDKDFGALKKLYDELESERVALYPMDLLGANADDYQQLQEILTAQYNRLDGVFLNAATLPAFTPIAHFDVKQWYEVLHTNLNANFHLMQSTLPLLLNAESGKLIAISDADIQSHPAYYGAYGVAKAGLEQLMRSVAEENRKQSLTCFLATLPAFATEARGRLFPGENPYDLPLPEQVAQWILDTVLNDRPNNWIHAL
jgi:NAD(P)-dependent dehydrogenase (short-subunit alcohol dehydrogenase family)